MRAIENPVEPRGGPSAALGASVDPSSPRLEALTRRLLALLGEITGLQSTYLTRIDWDRGEQEILFSRNTGQGVSIPEKLRVDWMDTLCRRALDGGPACTSDVASAYPGCAAATDLGIRTYVTVPVPGPDGTTFGTLCGASDESVELSAQATSVMETLAEMIALHLAREAASVRVAEQAAALVRANSDLERLALTDPMTRLANRRHIDRELSRLASLGRRRGDDLAVIVIDVDRFKSINDTHGHGVGDQVILAVADRLRGLFRTQDVIGRWGGDEFVVVLPATGCEQAGKLAERLRDDFSSRPIATTAGLLTVTVSVGVACGSGVDPAGILQRADDALYVAKGAGRDAVCYLESV